VLRRLREVSNERRIGARVGVSLDDEQTSTLELAECDALRALLAVPDARVVVAISPGVRELLARTSASYPRGSSFRRIEEPPGWVAVLGRRVCPTPPSAAAAREEAREPSSSISFSGTNQGIVAAAGRDVVVGNVQHRTWR
jgi:hypothetical protein